MNSNSFVNSSSSTPETHSAHPGSNCGTPPNSVAAGQKCSAPADCSGDGSCCYKFSKDSSETDADKQSPVSICFADKTSKLKKFTAVAPITDQTVFLTDGKGYPVSDCGTPVIEEPTKNTITNVCTHLSSFNNDLTVINLCKTLKT